VHEKGHTRDTHLLINTSNETIQTQVHYKKKGLNLQRHGGKFLMLRQSMVIIAEYEILTLALITALDNNNSIYS
jgi:hypothetical protein